MKKRLFLLIMAVAFIFTVHAQQWVIFSGSEPREPEVNVTTSNAQTVTFSVTLPGIYTQDTVVKGMKFTRLRLPGGGAVNCAGEPEIPVLTYRVAIPECEDAMVSFQVISQQNLPSCWVYPVPEIVWQSHPDGYSIPEEQFAFNAKTYAQPRIAEPTSIISSSGSFRDQQYVEVTLNLIEFCPVKQILSVIDKIEITVTFTNPVGDLLQELGTFSDVAASAFINYEKMVRGAFR